jgi:hypothetical protein
MAGLISAYFNDKNKYFSIFNFPDVKNNGSLINRICGEINQIFASNRIIKLSPEVIILAGLSKFQKTLFSQFKNVIIIDSAEEIDNKLKKFNNFNGDIYCKKKDLNIALHKAKKENKRILIDNSASPLIVSKIKKTVVSIIENKTDVDSIISINYISSIESDLYIIPAVSKARLEATKKYLFESSGNIDIQNKILSGFLESLNVVNFNNYKRAIFFTDGIPYGLLISNIIPNSHVFRNRSSYFIFDNLFSVEYRDVHFSFLNFSIFDKDESESIVRLFKKYGFYTKSLSRKESSSTRYNFVNYVYQFPYDFLHIGSHGGNLNGNFVKRDFTDKDGENHVLEYYEIIDFENTMDLDSKGEPLIGVTSKIIFSRLDGYKWGSDELSRAGINKSAYEYIEELASSNEHKDDKILSVKHDGYIPYFGHIECLDNIHQGNFHYLAGQTSPIVFNNSCSSWDEIASQWTGRGARGYVGTLWNIGEDTAKYSAESFYRMILKDNMELVCAVHSMNKRIKNKKYKNIYIFWGLPFIKTDKPEKRINQQAIIGEMSKFLIRLLSNLVVKYQKHKDVDKRNNGVKDNSFNAGEFILKILSTELKTLDLDELGEKIAETKTLKKTN